MAQSITAEQRIRELHDRAVAELVRAHEGRTDEPLLLAVRYRMDDPLDVYLFEVLAGFPGGDEDEVLTSEFAPSAQLRILGKLHLALCSPAQLRAAMARGDSIVDELRGGSVVFEGIGEGGELRAALGL